MHDANPYSAPASDVRRLEMEPVTKVRFFSLTGRLGRLRYLAYTFSMIFLIGVAFMAISTLLVGVVRTTGNTQLLGYFSVATLILLNVVMLVLSFMLVIRRIHDFNVTGWLSLLLLVPYLNILFTLTLWFIPGSAGTNRFGPQSPPNSRGVKVTAIIMPLLFVTLFGIIAAIAIPQYQKYAERAQQHRMAE